MSLKENLTSIIENGAALLLRVMAVMIACMNLVFLMADANLLRDMVLCILSLLGMVGLTLLSGKGMSCLSETGATVWCGILMFLAFLNSSAVTIGLVFLVIFYMLWRGTVERRALCFFAGAVFGILYSVLEVYKNGAGRELEKLLRSPALECFFILALIIFVWSENTGKVLGSRGFRRFSFVMIWVCLALFVAGLVFAGISYHSGFASAWMEHFRMESPFVRMCVQLAGLHPKAVPLAVCAGIGALLLVFLAAAFCVLKKHRVAISAVLLVTGGLLFGTAYVIRPVTNYICTGYQQSSITIPFAEVLVRQEALKGFVVNQTGDLISTDFDPWVTINFADYGIEEIPQNLNIIITSLTNEDERNQFYALSCYKFKQMHLHPGDNYVNLTFVHEDDVGVRLDLAQSEGQTLHVDRLVFNDFTYVVNFVHNLLKTLSYVLAVTGIMMIVLTGWNRVLLLGDVE